MGHGERALEKSVTSRIWKERINDVLYFLFNLDAYEYSLLQDGWEFSDELDGMGNPILKLSVCRTHSSKIHSEINEGLQRMGIIDSVLV